MLSWEMNSFGSQTLSAAWTPGLCSWAQPSPWPGLPCLGRLLETCLSAWSKPCHRSTFICLPLVLSQSSPDSSKARVLETRLLAAHCSVRVRNRRLTPKSVPASLLVLSNLHDSDLFLPLACVSALFRVVAMKSPTAASDPARPGFRAAALLTGKAAPGPSTCSSTSYFWAEPQILGTSPLHLGPLLAPSCATWLMTAPPLSSISKGTVCWGLRRMKIGWG